MDKKEIYTQTILKAANLSVNENVVKEKKILWWYNIRSKKEGGLRLTEEGIKFLSEEAKIKTYSVELPKKTKFTSQILIWLDNFINSPYFLSDNEIIVTEEKVAFELYLFSGDLQKLGSSKAMNKRLFQN
jgi:hypothetical protein